MYLHCRYNLADQQSQWMTAEVEEAFLNKRAIRPVKTKKRKKTRKENKEKRFDPKFHIDAKAGE